MIDNFLCAKSIIFFINNSEKKEGSRNGSPKNQTKKIEKTSPLLSQVPVLFFNVACLIVCSRYSTSELSFRTSSFEEVVPSPYFINKVHCLVLKCFSMRSVLTFRDGGISSAMAFRAIIRTFFISASFTMIFSFREYLWNISMALPPKYANAILCRMLANK